MVNDAKQVGLWQRLDGAISRWLPVFAVCGILAGGVWTAAAQGQPRVALRGHVPSAVAALKAVDRVPATNRLRLAISLPLRDEAGASELLVSRSSGT